MKRSTGLFAEVVVETGGFGIDRLGFLVVVEPASEQGLLPVFEGDFGVVLDIGKLDGNNRDAKPRLLPEFEREPAKPASAADARAAGCRSVSAPDRFNRQKRRRVSSSLPRRTATARLSPGFFADRMSASREGCVNSVLSIFKS